MRFFVTGATGGQGFPTVTTLLAAGHKVNALARNPDSSPAKQLVALGADVVKGDFGDVEALKAGARGCDGVFVLTMPGQAISEQQQAKNILEAAHAVGGLQAVVASTVTRAEEHEKFPRWSPDGFRASYWIGKTEVQELVRGSGMAWCVLQPAWMMTNMLPPVATFFWPELKTEGVLLSAFSPETDIQMTASEDVGRFAAQALISLAAKGDADAEREKWNGKIIRIASEGMTMAQIAAVVSKVSGKQVVAKFKSDAEVESMRDKNPLVQSQMWQRESGTQVDIAQCKSYGIKLTSFEEFLKENHEKFAEVFS